MAESAQTEVSFHQLDYLAFSIILFISAAIGLLTAFKHRRATAEQLLTGNRKLPLFPVVMSLTATFVSAITVLGLPVEAYMNNTEYWLVGLGYVPALLVTAFVFMPVIFRLRVTSAYQYLEFRFNRTVRICGSITFILYMMFYMAVVMYAPALALSQVTGLSLEISILTTGLVCTIYTALGGIKAVIWTDSFQVVFIFVGFVVMVIRSTQRVGGWAVVMERALEGRRFSWELDLNPDPFVRHTFWSLFIGGTAWTLSVYSANQAMLQRFISMRSVTSARWAIMLSLPMLELFLALSMMTGMTMYAFYYGCDPLPRGLITKADQLVPFFVIQILGDWPGLPGLFVACVFSASLSTVSSGVNSLAAVALEDFFRPCVKKVGKGTESERFKSIITIVSAVVFGLVTIGLAYLAGLAGQTVLQIGLSFIGMLAGPLLGLMVLGVLFPCVNSWGAGSGWLCSIAVSLWTGMGAIINPPAKPSIPSIPALTTALCNLTSQGGLGTSLSVYENVTLPASAADFWITYRLSYQYYALLAVIITVIVGVSVSAVTGFNKNRQLDRRTYIDILGYFKSSGSGKVSFVQSDEPQMPEDTRNMEDPSFQETRLL
ncbi:LOW QUALITY PROTEIN: sodium-coupled monocarboxylate transporter 1-like [Babylonia areolata]|uniref:LOW QUALITY PROTEIN: sodium-coupled monocarboxylate transporter 1-like n=1 Tax=Babylonia areolata TaxID=304850 RepID=UPI003FD139E8